MNEHSLFRNIVYQTILTIFNFLLPFFTGTYVVRVLSVDSFGVFNTASAYLSIFITIGSLTVNAYGVRELSQCQSRSEFEKIYSELFLMRLLCNLGTFGICIVFLKMTVTEHFWIYAVLAFQIITNIFAIEWVNTAKEEFRFITFKTIAVRCLYVLILVCFVRKEDDVLPYCCTIMVTEFLNNFISFLYIRRTVRLVFKGLHVGRHFKSIAILTMSSNVGVLYTSLDKVFLAWYCGEKSVSYYTISATIFAIVISLYAGILGGVTPRLAALRKKCVEEYRMLLKYVADSYMILVIPSCIGLIVLAPEVLIMYGSEKYLAATPVMVVQGVYRIFMYYEAVISSLVLYQYGKEKRIFIYLLVFGLLNAAANVLLAVFGVLTEVTTVAASAVLYLVMVICYLHYIHRKIDCKLKIITTGQLRYLALSLLFLPISFLVRQVMSNIFLISICTAVPCIVVYSTVLIWTRDEAALLYLQKLKEIRNGILDKVGKKQ